MADLSERIASLSPEQRTLLERRLKQRGSDGSQTQRIPRRSADSTGPLSFAQERLWFLDQLQPGNPTYNIPAAMRMTVPLHIAALERSLNAIIRRHEILRTTFAVVDGSPVQVVAPTLTVALPLRDLRHLPPAAREAEAQQMAAAEAQQPFDLARGPLLRAALLRLGPTDHVLLLTMHHIVSDGWSLTIFFRELGAIYGALASGKPAPLPELPIQYADFAHWQRQRLQGTALEAQLAYWRSRLAGAPAVLDLPTDRPRPPMQTFNGALYVFEVPQEVAAQLAALSQQEGATLFMALLAAFQTLLYRYTGQTDVVVGAPIAGRTRVETEGLIGFFVNTLVLRTSLAGNPSFRELLGLVREMTLGAYAHQDLPFEKLVEELQPERNLSHNPLFQVAFALQNVPTTGPAGSDPAQAAANTPASAPQAGTGTAKFDLLLAMVEAGQGLQGGVEYNTDLFDAATVARLVGHFQTLLAGAAARPEAPLGQLPLLTEAERRQLAQWNATQAEYPHTQCFHQLFEAQAALRPDALAVVFEGLGTGDWRPPTNDQRPTTPSPLHPFTPSPLHPFNQQLTYAELNARANQLAHYLRKRQVGPEVRVGICMQRSPEMLVGLLAILKAGGAYVPLDPAYPPARLAFMIEDSQAALLITTTDHRPTTDRPPTDHRPTTTADASAMAADVSAMTADASAMAADASAMAADASAMAADASTTTADASAMTADASTTTADASAMTADASAASTARLPTLRLRSRQVIGDPRPMTAIQNPKSKIVNLDADWPTIAAEGVANVATGVRPDNLAYVMYTSGSTGTPKGVLVAHCGVCNSAAVEVHALETRPGDRVLQFFSLSFDASLFELAMTLPAGATLHLAPQEMLLPGPSLCELLRRQAISIYATAPSVLAALPLEPFPALRTLIVLGEACAADLVARWGAGRRVFNAYGPTEATMWAAGTYIDGSRRPPIGRAIANTQVYLLDRQLQLVPVGVVGELYIGGVGLARGYHRRPDLTAERFVPNPFAEVLGVGCWVLEDKAPNTQHPSPNTRLYKTGDLARYLPDGEIEYLGRGDAQVKLRGFRIELGEIEAVLRQHEAVHKSVVVAREDVVGEKRLVAYLVTSNKSQVTSSEDSSLVTGHSSLVTELRSFLQTKLPDYMVPAAFVTLEALPLGPSGKLDVRGLPAPDWVHPAAADEFVAPRTEVEELVAGIWAEVLGVERIGVHDNFFAIGGHSLRATQVVARVRETLQVELPLRRLFEAPTVAGLAQAIAQAQGQPEAGAVSAISRLDRGNEEQLLAELDRYSDDQVIGLLGDLLAEKERLAE